MAENSLNGFIVGTVKATDQDGDALTYKLVNDADSRFIMDGDDLRVLDGSRFNDQIEPTHTVKVRVTDQHGAFADKDFVIRVMDRNGNPPPPPAENHAPIDIVLSDQTIAENSQAGTVVSVLFAKDPDAGETFSYTLLDNAGGRFAIIGDELIVANGSKLDYEAARSHTVTVQATDSHGASFQKIVNIYLEDETDEEGGDANDTILGGDGDDVLSGNNGQDSITGGEGNDTLSGGNGNDRLFGGRGNDVMSGDLGADILTGGAGKDTFIFATKLGKANVDTITDFSVKDDTIHLSKSIFRAVGKKGFLAKDAFTIGTKAQNADDRIVYNSKTGKLFYDADGNGDQAEIIHFATVGKGLKLTNLDFFIV